MKKPVKKQWKELSKGRRGMIVVAGVLQLSLQAAALRDIARRTPSQVNGSKVWWVTASFINFFGPFAYFVKGRKKQGQK